MMYMNYQHLLVFGSVMVAAWFLCIYFWPRMMLSVYRRGLLVKGFGDGPIPVNTLYTEPQKLFAEPLTSQTASSSNLMTVGVNHDTLSTAGWLDLKKGPLVLHVPDMNDRYYSVQFTDPSKNTNFAYVGTRTTGTQAGDYLITGPGWKEQVPSGMLQIASPNNSVLVFGRVLAAAGMEPAEPKRDFGDRIAFHGGISTQQTLPFGTPAEVKAETRRVRQMMSAGGTGPDHSELRPLGRARHGRDSWAVGDCRRQRAGSASSCDRPECSRTPYPSAPGDDNSSTPCAR